MIVQSGWHILAPLLILALLAAAPASQPTTAPASEVALGRKLSRKLPEVSINGIPLADVLDFVRDVGRINVVVNWRELEKLHVNEHRPVTFSGQNVTVGDLLREVLASVSSKVSYDAKAGAIYVTSKADLFARAGDVRVAGDGSDASAKVNATLDKVLPDVRLQSVRLRDAFRLVEQNLQVPLEVDWRSLEEAGVDGDEPVTLSLKQPTGAEVLHWIIRPLQQRRPVVFTVRDGTVVVTAAPPDAKAH